MPRVRHLECSDCHSSVPAAGTFIVNGTALCEPCADKQVVEIQKVKGKLEVFRGKDPTICWKCSGDFGSQELPLVAGLHTCDGCKRSILDFHYPTWLKTAAAALLALLVISLIHGRTYFVAGHAYYKGKKLLDSGNAKAAVPYLEQALTVGRHSEEVVGNAALAYLRIGRADEAYRIAKDQTFKDSNLYHSLTSGFEQFERAATKADESVKLFGEHKYKEAAQRMREAATILPTVPAFTRQADLLDASVRFYDKDYTGMTELLEAQWSKYGDYEAAASLAGAYACLYASEGDETMKQKAAEMMEKAKTLASTKQDKADLEEWEPRFNHRIETRKIMDRYEYNAQFRPQAAAKEEQQ